MVHAFSLLAAAAEAGHESSKTAFYICGGLLAVWAVVVALLGLSRVGFPGNRKAERGVLSISAVLVVAAMATAVITA
jgi:hypothetical protein